LWGWGITSLWKQSWGMPSNGWLNVPTLCWNISTHSNVIIVSEFRFPEFQNKGGFKLVRIMVIINKRL
jgi:hypothetical protein